MAKPRLVEPGGIYHVSSRGTNREQIFFDDESRSCFLDQLARVVDRAGWTVYVYCLMTNHFHLVLQMPGDSLSRGMQILNGGYARKTNARLGRVRHLFQNRFSSTMIKRDSHLRESCRYVVLNPVRAGMCGRPEDWRWSSYRASVGLAPAPAFLSVDSLLGLFGRSPSQAQAAFGAFIDDALLLHWSDQGDEAVTGW